ncbi:hypothetical protein JBE27_36560, partial [Streptomyces albiflaviniger]|nr:hypothetical protein [Streptomyces albiflaviniger]
DGYKRQVGTCATVGPASLVMRGETLPADTSWLGNPIAAWKTEKAPDMRKTEATAK